MRAESGSTSYDQNPYPTQAYAETHPDHLASVAILFGLSPPSVSGCRVLEIGCGDGGNIIPMAASLPASDFVGIDLASLAIAKGRTTIERAGLPNIQLFALDLMNLTPEFGLFDYIIAHGFYSWVPPAIQDQCLAVCRSHLSPGGVAFVSYNARPAGHLRTAVREMMLFHVEQTGRSSEKVRAGKEFLQFVAGSGGGSPLWERLLQTELERLEQRDERGVFHDELNPFFSTCSFVEFIDAARRHSLQYISDAKLRDEFSPLVKPEVLSTIEGLAGGDPIARQQYLDFVLFHGFHRTLLCHEDVRVDRQNVAGGWPDSGWPRRCRQSG